MKKTLCLSSALVLLTSTAVFAQDSATKKGLLNFAVGYYDVFDEQDGVDFRIEYRMDSLAVLPNLKPWIGAEVTSEGSVWGGGGLLYDWEFTPNWYFSPGIGVGLYSDGGSDKDLEHPVQFRTQFEIAYEFESNHRVGVSMSHMSNAGLGDDNPGTEVISLNWSYPF